MLRIARHDNGVTYLFKDVEQRIAVITLLIDDQESPRYSLQRPLPFLLSTLHDEHIAIPPISVFI